MGTEELLTKGMPQGGNFSQASLQYAKDRKQSSTLLLGDLLQIIILRCQMEIVRLASPVILLDID